MPQTNYTYDDGGRIAAGMKSDTDCGIRAIAIATGMEYHAARKFIKEFANIGKQGNRSISRGIWKEDMDAALRSIGWFWCSAPKFEGRKARYSDIPGVAILRMARHYSTVKDGTLHDSWDSSHKMVYGYWCESAERKRERRAAEMKKVVGEPVTGELAKQLGRFFR